MWWRSLKKELKEIVSRSTSLLVYQSAGREINTNTKKSGKSGTGTFLKSKK
jgi:hypothetical protein